MSSANAARIMAYMQRFFPGHELREDEDIFALGFVNSMFAMQLVTFVEHEFGIALETEDLEIDNFRTVKALGGLVGRKTAAS